MEGFALLSLMLIATHVGGSEPTQARGFDEGGWSPPMNQQPEILLVKEKGPSSSASSSSMKMKDLTPLICLLAPLLLAAIMLPAKMTMMMNSMMASNSFMPMVPTGMLPSGMLPGGMLPGINGMLPGINGMLPSGMLPGGMIPLVPLSLPLTSLLTNGMGNNNNHNSLGLPIFKNLFESKKFSEGEHQQADNDTHTKDISANNQDVEVAEDSKKNKKSDWYTVNAAKSSSSLKSTLKKISKMNKSYKGDNMKHEWASRVWSTQPSEITLAEEILKLFDEVSNLIL